MSLLERLGRRHLSDRAFAQVWTTGGGHPHLESCAACRTRFDEFERWVIGVGEAARAEADAVFTPERLAAQQMQIARRLETLERPARVIAFPKAARAVMSGHSHVRRWVTAAAAAGLLFAGVGLGEILRPWNEAPNRPESVSTLSAVRPATHRQPASANSEVVPSIPDEELLSDSFAQPRVQDLSALDDMTPHARDLVQRQK